MSLISEIGQLVVAGNIEEGLKFKNVCINVYTYIIFTFIFEYSVYSAMCKVIMQMNACRARGCSLAMREQIVFEICAKICCFFANVRKMLSTSFCLYE